MKLFVYHTSSIVFEPEFIFADTLEEAIELYLQLNSGNDSRVKEKQHWIECEIKKGYVKVD